MVTKRFELEHCDTIGFVRICKSYLTRLTIRKKNRNVDMVIFEGGWLTWLAVKHEMSREGIKRR